MLISRDGAARKLVGLITRRSLVQIQLPQPKSQRVEIGISIFFIYPQFLVPTVFLILRLAGENRFLVTFGLYLARNSCFVRNYHIKTK